MSTSSTIKSTNINSSSNKLILNNLNQVATITDELNYLLKNSIPSNVNEEHEILYYLLYNELSGNHGIIPKVWYDLINFWKHDQTSYNDLGHCLSERIWYRMNPLVMEEKSKEIEKPKSFIDYLATTTDFNRKFFLYLFNLSKFKTDELASLILKEDNWDEQEAKSFRTDFIKKSSLILNDSNVTTCNKLLNLLGIIFWYKQEMLPFSTETNSYQIEIVSSSTEEPTHISVPTPKTFDFGYFNNHKLNNSSIQCFVDKDYMETLVEEIRHKWDDIVNDNLDSNYLTSLDELGLGYILKIDNYCFSQEKELNLDKERLNQVTWPIISYQLNPYCPTRILLETENNVLKGWEEQIQEHYRKNWNVVRHLKKPIFGEEHRLLYKIASSWLRWITVQALINEDFKETIIDHYSFLMLEVPTTHLPEREKISRTGKNKVDHKIIKILIKSVLSFVVSLLLEWVLFKILQQNYSTMITSWIEFGILRRNRNFIVSFFLVNLLYCSLILPNQLNWRSED